MPKGQKLIEVTTKALFWVPERTIIDPNYVQIDRRDFYAEPTLITPDRHVTTEWAQMVEGSEETTITEVKD